MYYIDLNKDYYLLENNTFFVRYEFPSSLNVHYSKIEVTESNLMYIACKTDLTTISSNNLILKSTDNGLSWDTSYMVSSAFIKEIKFISDSIGFAVGDSGTIIKTIDAGQTWAMKLTGLSNSLRSIDCLNTSTWVATGDFGLILITTDGGETWINVDSPTDNALIKTKIPEENGIVFIQTYNHIWKANIFDLVTNVELAEDGGKDFNIYPNPANDHFTIENKSHDFQNTTLEIFNLMGEKVFGQNLILEQENIDCRNFPEGIYFVKLSYKGKNVTQRLVIQ